MQLIYKSYAKCQPRFGKCLVMDIGASNGGSLKIQETDNDGNRQGISRNYTIPSFATKDEFFSHIKTLVDTYHRTQPSPFPSDENIDKIIVFAPGLPTKEPGTFSAFNNLKLSNGQILKNINFNRLKELLGAPKAQLIALSDVVGGFAGALSQIAKRQPKLLAPGQKITFAVTGGGLGMVDGLVKDREVHFACSEAGTMLDEVKGEPLELAKTSVTALTKNFIQYLNQHYPLDLQNINAKSLPGKVVTNYTEAKKAIPTITPEQYQNASASAIKEFMHGLVNAYHVRVNSGTKLAILGGPVLDGIKAYLQQYPDTFKKEVQEYDKLFPEKQSRPVMEKVFLESLYQRLSDSKKDFFLRNQFDVITDIPITNNTLGAKYVLQGKRDTHEYHYNVPLSAFKLKTE